jgi:hypothetical protein
MSECTGHSGLHLLPLPQAVIKGVVARGGIMTLSTPIKGTEILRLAQHWAADQWDLIPHVVPVLGIVERDTVVLPEGEFTPVSLSERDLVARLLEEAAYAWRQDAVGEHGNPKQPEWAEQVYDHLAFYVTCAYRQGWVS